MAPAFTDTITAGFTWAFTLNAMIEIQPAVRVGDHWFSRIPDGSSLNELMILSAGLSKQSGGCQTALRREVEKHDGGSLTQGKFLEYRTVSSWCPGDILPIRELRLSALPRLLPSQMPPCWSSRWDYRDLPYRLPTGA